MIDPGPAIDERRPPITPQLALRVAVLGGIAFVLFAIIFFRLWYLQVLSGDQYLAAGARQPRARAARAGAARRHRRPQRQRAGREPRRRPWSQIDPESLPAAERNAAATWGQHVTARSRRPEGQEGPAGRRSRRRPRRTWRPRFKSLARVLDMSPQDDPGARRAVAGVAALRQRHGQGRRRRPAAQLPGRAPRGLPRHRRRAQVPAPLPAALAGGPARRAASARSTTRELKLKRFKGVKQGTVVGQGGLERSYDQLPARRRRLDQGHHRRARAARRARRRARPGARALGAHDARPRSAADRREVPRPDDQPGPRHGRRRSSRSTRATAACSRWAPIRRSTRRSSPSRSRRPPPIALFGDSGGAPLFNRAIGGSYPTGSTFKPITALAAHEQRRRARPSDVIDDHGCIKIGTAGQEACNAGKEALGPVNMTSALSKSSDVYFYTLGQRLNALAGPAAAEVGAAPRASATGPASTCPGEFGGTVPDRAWRDRAQRRGGGLPQAASTTRAASPTAPTARGPWATTSTSPSARATCRPRRCRWRSPTRRSPTAASVVRPHLGAAVEDPAAACCSASSPARPQHVDDRPGRAARRSSTACTTADRSRAARRPTCWQGLEPGRYPVYGKTGTAAAAPAQADQSWYVVLRAATRARRSSSPSPSSRAASAPRPPRPAARLILSKWFGAAEQVRRRARRQTR